MTQRSFLLIILLSVAAGVAGFFLHQAEYPLTYDEGDYYLAVQRGFWVNWTDHDDLPLTEFVRMGMDALGDAEARARLSDYIRGSGSTMFLRHYHPPLAFYPAIALSHVTGGMPLHWQLRLSNLFWVLLWIAVIGVIGWRHDSARTPLLLLLPASSAYAMAVVGFNMHLPFGLMLTLFLFCLYLYERGGEASMLRLTQLFFAATLVTVAYGMFVVFFTVLFLFWRFWKSTSRFAFLRRVGRSVVWVAGFLLLLWPASLLTLNLLKNWVFVIYIAVFRLPSETVAFDNWWELLFDKWNANPFELLLIPTLLIIVLLRARTMLRHGSVCIATGFSLALLYLQMNPTLVYRWYLFPVSGIMLFFLPFVVSQIFGNWGLQRPVPIGVAATVLFVSALFLVPKPDYSELISLHKLVAAEKPSAMTLPRSVYPQLRPYYPDAAITSYHDDAYGSMNVPDSMEAWQRRGLVLVPVGVQPPGLRPDASTEHYLLFRPKDARDIPQ
ncbi:MAG: hypothetical protein M5R41_12710 [Bacteroidia bacterium]|nr:hypothetical protein [Bacteroidia bacterium]